MIEGVETSDDERYGFEIIGKIRSTETIAIVHSIRELPKLRKLYGPGRWLKRKGYAKVRLIDGSIFDAELHWYEAHGIGKRQTKIKRLSKPRERSIKRPATNRHLAVCVRNRGYEVSLELRKLYEIIPDSTASAHKYLRVVDESGEDYLYPANYFVAVELPKAVQKAVLLAS